MKQPIPVTVIGGYLGAGKTTLVNHLLRNAAGLRIAVLVNDFGDLPIDADLIEAEEEDLISIAGGCVCCSFGSDLMAALMQLPLRDPSPQHVIIETSGVALPGVVAASAALVQGLARDATAVVADALTVRERAADRYMGDTLHRQFAEADLVLLNKTDLVDEAALAGLRTWLHAAAPRAALVESVRSQVPLEVVLGRGAAFAGRPGVLSPGAIRSPESAAARYESASFNVPGRIDVPALSRALCDPALNLLRAKGVLRDRDGALRVLQLVGTRCEVTAYAGPDDVATGLACIAAAGRLARPAIASAVSSSMAASMAPLTASAPGNSPAVRASNGDGGHHGG